jgi:hypothetical protein
MLLDRSVSGEEPLLANGRGGRIAQRLLAKMWQSPLISSELLRFCLHLLKVEEARKILIL